MILKEIPPTTCVITVVQLILKKAYILPTIKLLKDSEITSGNSTNNAEATGGLWASS